MSDEQDRPSTLPCSHCGASMPVSWASGHGVASCQSCSHESYVFDPPLPLPDLVVALDALIWPTGLGAGAGAGRVSRGMCELASATPLTRLSGDKSSSVGGSRLD